MPRKQIDYSKTVMYKIVCKDKSVKDMYVGSTTAFANRKYNHKHRCYNKENSKHHLELYKTIRRNGHWENWNMILIEKYPCADKLEQAKREIYWGNKLHANLNMISP